VNCLELEFISELCANRIAMRQQLTKQICSAGVAMSELYATVLVMSEELIWL
jgi:hypothetical protein